MPGRDKMDGHATLTTHLTTRHVSDVQLYVFGMESAMLIEDCYFGLSLKKAAMMAITQITLLCYLHMEPFISGA